MYQIIEVYKGVNFLLESKHKKQLIILIIEMIIGGLFEFFSLSLLVPYIGLILNKKEFFKLKLIKNIIETLNIDSYNEIIILLSIIVIFIFFIKNTYLYFLKIRQVTFISYTRNDISVKIMKKFLNESYKFHLKHNSVELETIIINNIARSFVLIERFLSFTTEFCLVIFICIFLFYFNFIITTGLGILSLFIFGCVKCIITPQIVKNGKESNDYFQKMLKSIRESLCGIKEIKANQEEEFFLNIYRKIGSYNAEIDIKSVKWSNIIGHLLEFFLIFTICGIIMFLTLFYDDSQKAMEILVIISVYLIRLIPSVNKLISYFNGIAYNIPAITELNENALKETNDEKYKLERIKEKNIFCIELREIYFKYENRKEYIFNNLNISIKKGEIVGILGESGTGKTTFINLLLGLLTPNKGEILIDGKKSKGLIGSINIGYIPQNIFLLEDSIRNNIKFGYSATDDELWKVLERVNLKNFVMSLEKKLDTNIGENGIFLSGGQRQRLAIARALLRNIEILILDEGTCNLDNATEKNILEQIVQLKSELFIIIVSHHKHTYDFCNRLIKLN